MKILVTAGPTREAIDPVRYLSNRSSGTMGFAIAEAAATRGHEVVLVSGPCGLKTPAGVARMDVVSAEEMYDAVEREIGGVDAAVFAAAVADYRPVTVAGEKIKKTADTLTIELEKTKDVLGSARVGFGFGGVLVGFAAETERVEEYTRGKLERKGCDLVVANDVSRPDIGFDVSENEVMVLFSDGRVERPTKATKRELGEILLGYVEEVAGEKGG